MPYIDGSARERLDRGGSPETPGELNYAITRLLDEYLNRRRPAKYADLNEVLGAIESAKLEFYRRIVVPYEEGKLQKTGDVYRSLEQS